MAATSTPPSTSSNPGVRRAEVPGLDHKQLARAVSFIMHLGASAEVRGARSADAGTPAEDRGGRTAPLPAQLARTAPRRAGAGETGRQPRTAVKKRCPFMRTARAPV